MLGSTGNTRDDSAAIVQGIIAANHDNRTALREIRAPAWVASSDVRGTLSIVWSCVITIIACVYTALHLNIPKKHGAWNILLHKTKWVAIALVAPEIVLYVASSQFFAAYGFQRQMKSLFRQRVKEDTDLDESIFTLSFCFFVNMGGFQVSIKDIYPSPSTSSTKDLPAIIPFSAEGIVQLAKHGHFITISKTRLQDRSKADILQKVLVVAQVGWMAVQCAFRGIYGLPISLLEVHTLVHVACALTMYAFWIKKPVDIREAEIVNPESFSGLLALMVQEQFCDKKNPNYILYPPMPTDSQQLDLAAMITVDDDDTFVSKCKPSLDRQGGHVPLTRLSRHNPWITLRNNQALICGLGHGGPEISKFGFQKRRVTIEIPQCYEQLREQQNLLPEDVRRVQQLIRHIRPNDDCTTLEISDEDMEAVKRLRGQIESSGKYAHLLQYLEELDDATKMLFSVEDIARAERVVDQLKVLEPPILEPQPYAPMETCRYWESDYQQSFLANPNVEFLLSPLYERYVRDSVEPMGRFREPYLAMQSVLHGGFPFARWANAVLVLLLPAAYGGIHLAALKYEFPTDMEQQLWAASCYVIIIAVPALWTVSFIVHSCFACAGDSDESLSSLILNWYYFFLIIVASVLYISSRIFIILESVLSMRLLPVGVYWMPSWLQMIPHL